MISALFLHNKNPHCNCTMTLTFDLEVNTSQLLPATERAVFIMLTTFFTPPIGANRNQQFENMHSLAALIYNQLIQIAAFKHKILPH